MVKSYPGNSEINPEERRVYNLDQTLTICVIDEGDVTELTT